jgi:AcrR family transcriptional regulator
MTPAYHHGALREALLQSAEAILDRDGVGALTLRAAAREAGVSHAAPAHHFGDLTGLLTALAAAGFARLRARLQAGIDAAGPDADAQLIALGHVYVGFARTYPGLFQLMFRSERLDWSSPELVAAGDSTFALLTENEPGGSAPAATLVVAMSRWSLVHGLATLLIDGRVIPFAEKAQVDTDHLIERVIAGIVDRHDKNRLF